MLISPSLYLENINFENFTPAKQKNYIKYAKGQITHYQKEVTNPIKSNIVITPGPDVHLWWWQEVLQEMEKVKQ